MIAKRISVCVLVAACAAFAALPACGVMANTDPAYTPIPIGGLGALINQNKHDTEGIFKVLFRAVMQHEAALAYTLMDDLATKEPNNTTVLQGYCMIRDAALGRLMFGGLPLPPDPASEHLASQSYALYNQRLMRSEVADTKPWLALVLDGQTLLCDNDDHRRAEGLAKVKRAVLVAPDIAVPHLALAEALLVPHAPANICRAAIRELEIAERIDPSSEDTALTFFQVYAVLYPDHAMALKWKAAMLSRVPAPTDLRPDVQRMLKDFR